MMTLVKRAAIGAVAVLGLTFAMPPAAALAIDQVNCDGRNDFLKVVYYIPDDQWGEVCFANAGPVGISIQYVAQFSSGNNTVTVNYEKNGQYYTETVGPWTDRFPDYVRVYEVRIW